MKFAEFICNDAIMADLQAQDKEGAIREMVQSLLDAGKIEESEMESIIQALLKREELGSTGIGRGMAVPHTTHPSITNLVGLVAVSRKGVEFASLDGAPVDVFFLVISPPDRPGDHLRALENISRQLCHDTFRRFLTQGETVESLVQLLEDADDNHFED